MTASDVNDITTGDRNPRRKSFIGDVCVVYMAYQVPTVRVWGASRAARMYVQYNGTVPCRVHRCAEVRGYVGCRTNT